MKKYKIYFDKRDTPFDLSYQAKDEYHTAWFSDAYRMFLGHIPVKVKFLGIKTIWSSIIAECKGYTAHSWLGGDYGRVEIRKNRETVYRLTIERVMSEKELQEFLEYWVEVNGNEVNEKLVINGEIQ